MAYRRKHSRYIYIYVQSILQQGLTPGVHVKIFIKHHRDIPPCKESPLEQSQLFTPPSRVYGLQAYSYFMQIIINPLYQGSLNPKQQTNIIPLYQGRIHPIQQRTIIPLYQGSLNPIQQRNIIPLYQGSLNATQQRNIIPLYQGSLNPI